MLGPWREGLAGNEGTSMSYTSHGPTHAQTSTVTRVTAAMRKIWTDARHTDRQLMEMRTNLSRHSG
jgi:hypothetical protein